MKGPRDLFCISLFPGWKIDKAFINHKHVPAKQVPHLAPALEWVLQNGPMPMSPKAIQKYFKVLRNNTKCMHNGFSIVGWQQTWTNLFSNSWVIHEVVYWTCSGEMSWSRIGANAKGGDQLILAKTLRCCGVHVLPGAVKCPLVTLLSWQTNHGTCFQTKDVTPNTNSTRLDSLWNFGFVWHSRQIVVYGFQPYFGVKNLWHWCLVL